MKRLLLATALLSTAISDEISFQKPSQVSRQIWPKRSKRIPRELLRCEPDGNLRQDSTEFLEIPNLKLATSYVDEGKRSEYTSLPSFQNLECRTVKPTILLSIDLRKLLGNADQFDPNCTSGKCRHRTQGWQLQQPFYVEEPRWIEIHENYADTFAQELQHKDPYVLSRGKKIFRLKDAEGLRTKTLLDYDGLSAGKDSQGLDAVDVNRIRFIRPEKQVGKRNRVPVRKEDERSMQSRDGNQYSESLESLDKYEDPFFLSRGKKMYTRRDLYRTKHYSEDYDDYEERSGVVSKSVRNKRSVDKVKEDETMRDSQKTTNGRETRLRDLINNRNESRNTGWSFQKVIPTEESSDDLEFKEDSAGGNSMDEKENYPSFTQSLRKKANEFFMKDRKDEEDGIFMSSREKRSNYADQIIANSPLIRKREPFEDNQLSRSVGGPKGTNVNYVQRRDIFDILEEPFFISRGKKSPLDKSANEEAEFTNDDLFNFKIKNILDEPNCISGECANDLEKIVKRKAPRDRRGTLDDLLVKYDPFFVARGKRTLLNLLQEISKERNIETNSEFGLKSFLKY